MKRLKIEVLLKGKSWFWRLVGSNGRTMAHSETYSSVAKAKQSAKRLLKILDTRAFLIEIVDK